MLGFPDLIYPFVYSREANLERIRQDKTGYRVIWAKRGQSPEDPAIGTEESKYIQEVKPSGLQEGSVGPGWSMTTERRRAISQMSMGH